MTVVGRAVYRHGRRVEEFEDVGAMASACRHGGGMAWIGLAHPTRAEFEEVTREFFIHELAVEDAVKAHQRAKLERYDDTLYCVLRPARYVDATETVEFGEVHVFAGPFFVITVRHGEMPDLGSVRRDLEGRPELLERGPMAVMHAILDRVVDDYAPVLAGIANDVDEIEDEVFAEDTGQTVSRRIYELSREVIAFQRATKPLVVMLEALMAPDGTGEDERKYLRDVLDHTLRLEEQSDAYRELLRQILSVNLTLETKALNEASNRQNEQVKKISGWAAILFAPSIVGTIYGMNFEHMPELEWRVGYPLALLAMVIVSLALYAFFRRRQWM